MSNRIEAIRQKALADVKNIRERAITDAVSLELGYLKSLAERELPTPRVTVEPSFHVDAAAPAEVNVAAPEVHVTVDLSELANLLGNTFAALTQGLADLACAIREQKPVEFRPTINVPAPVVNVAAPEVTIEVPEREPRTMTIEHIDDHTTKITEE